MKMTLLKLIKMGMSLLYGLLRLLPVRGKKILFLSRQANRPSLDFDLLQSELKGLDENLQMVSICRRIESGFFSSLAYAVDLVRSMYHLSTSRVCVLDSYWPAVSALKHKGSLTIIQMWHSLGKIKQSGLVSLDRPGGRSSDLARLMNMHANYDYVIAGAKAWNPYYCESFGCSEDQILNVGLPRMDYIVNSMERNAQRIKAALPECEGRRIILYAPTFRKNKGGKDHRLSELASLIDPRRFALIVKAHPNQFLEAEGILTCPDFTALELLSVADYLVTDYSAIALEGALAGVKTFYYVYDYDEYKETNGLNIDLYEEMPGCVFSEGVSLVRGIDKAECGLYPLEVFEKFCGKYLIQDRGHSTTDIASLVLRFVR